MNFKELLTRWNHGVFHGAIRCFADKIGRHEVTVGEWVRGPKRPGEKIRVAVARELGVSVATLMASFGSGGGSMVIKEPIASCGPSDSAQTEMLGRINAILDRLDALEDKVNNLASGGRLRRHGKQESAQ